MLPDYIKHPFYLIFRPISGYWELKYENKGRLWIAFGILLLLAAVMTLTRQFSGFTVNFNNPMELNSVNELKYIVFSYFLWCTANWSLTTLMDGEGKFKEILVATGYALLPFILIYLPNILLSNLITVREVAFYETIQSIAFFWFLALLFVGTMVIHQYTVTKTLVTMFLTLVVMGIIMFLGLLLFSLIQQIAAFIYTVYQEIQLRI